jgi:hypothetical protein
MRGRRVHVRIPRARAADAASTAFHPPSLPPALGTFFLPSIAPAFFTLIILNPP